jgi:hypothetical protein
MQLSPPSAYESSLTHLLNSLDGYPLPVPTSDLELTSGTQ